MVRAKPVDCGMTERLDANLFPAHVTLSEAKGLVSLSHGSPSAKRFFGLRLRMTGIQLVAGNRTSLP